MFVFSRAVSQLSETRLENSHLRHLQVTALTDLLHTKRTRLRILDLSLNCLAGLDPLKLAVIMNDIVDLNLSQTQLTGLQVKELFKVMAEKTRVEILKINEVDLSCVPANILSDALTKVELKLGNYICTTTYK